MKNIGIIRSIDDLGRFVIPKEIRRTMHLKEGQAMEIFVDGENLVLSAYRLQCVCCGDKDESKLRKKNDVLVCSQCIEDLSHE